MRICIISDTHSYHRKINIPKCDLLIHCGDFSFKGELNIISDFCDWLGELPIEKRVIIAGNHELGLACEYKRPQILEMIEKSNSIYLEDSFTIIDGLKIYGSPYQPLYHNWEYNLPRGKALADKWAQIPDDTDILVTHGPPFGIGDEAPRGISSYENVGCKDLLNRIYELKNLKIHCYGHIHQGYYNIPRRLGGIDFINAAICTESYKPTNKPIIIEL